MESSTCNNCNRNWDDDEFPAGDIQSWAHFDNDDNIFHYCFSQYKLLSDVQFKKDDRVCNTCLKTMSYEPYCGVHCPFCLRKFHTYYGDMGHGCSAEIKESLIDCGFGSRYDGDMIKFAGERPKDLALGLNICDHCITKLIHDGVCIEPDHIDTSATMSLNIPVI